MRILVCRPLAGAERSAERLRALGHEPVVAPVLTVRPLDSPPPTGRPDAIVLTSAEAAFALARVEGGRSARLFAVGERTRASAERAGFPVAHGGAGTARDLVDAVAGAMPAGATILLPVGHDRKPEPERSLRAAGFRVLAWEVYEAVAADRLPAEADAALRGAHLDGALHFSRRSAAVLAGLAARAGLQADFASISHHCLSADVAAGLAGVPSERILVARRPDEDALLATLG